MKQSESKQSESKQSELAFEFGNSLVGLLRVLESIRRTVATREGLADTEYKALVRIVDAGEITPKDLSLTLDITTGAVTAITDRLVASDLIERAPHPRDRRSVLLTPTPAALELTARTFARFRTTIAKAVTGVSDDQIRTLTEILNTTSAKMSASNR